jgi:transposase
MDKKWKYQLSDEAVQQLERAMHNDGRVEVVQRATALRQLHQGSSPQAVAEMFAVSASTIYHWWERWQAGGVEALSQRPRQGRPPKADADYWAKMAEVLDSDPKTHGYPFTVWTTARLRDHLTQITGIRLSVEWLRVQMEARGYVYRRPKADLRVLQDPQARAEAEQLLRELKKTPKQKLSSFSLWTQQP